jgi:hypothetical protein
MTKEELRLALIESLTSQGFSVNGTIMPSSFQKSHFKKIQAHSKKEQFRIQNNFLRSGTETVQKYIRDGIDIDPQKIELEFRLVEPGSEEETIFRWWNLVWWSVPYQKAYGRQIRILLWDKTHNAPFGLIGLQSPVLKIAARDTYLKIPSESLDTVINSSMQAQRLGALPPYNQIIGGKMVGLAVTSNELRDLYKLKYDNVQTVMMERVLESSLLFVTTTSAFGRSSIYNRLKFNNELVAKSLGYTKGSGTFHVTQELYYELQKFLQRRKIDTNTTFGYGASRKVKLIDKGFSLLNLKKYHFHNLQREFFIFPLAENLLEVISNGDEPIFYNRSLLDLQEFWKTRWAIPRAERDHSWQEFNARNFIIATKKNITRWSNKD